MNNRDREAFEEWAGSNGYSIEPLRFSPMLEHSNYCSVDTNRAWLAWQAARADVVEDMKLLQKALLGAGNFEINRHEIREAIALISRKYLGE